MKLEWKPAHEAFVLRVPRIEAAKVQSLITEHGFDLSTTASSPGEAVLMTKEHYAAATFNDIATPEAREQLASIVSEIEASWRAVGTAHIACPADKELWPFQIADIEYALRRQNTLIGDQPGLGKTPIAICFANEIRAKRVLVVCPAAIRGQWVTRIREWTTIRYPLTIHPIFSARNGTNPAANYTIVSYELARHPEIMARLILEGRFDLIVLDEVHYLKTIDSLRTVAMFGSPSRPGGLANHAGAILGLSGTPLLNRPREAYTIARAFCYDAIDWMSEDKFKKRFNPSLKREGLTLDGTPYVYVDERSGRHAELQNRLRGNFMVRHLKREVMPQLKLPLYDLIRVDETEAVKAALEVENMLDIDPDTLEGRDFENMGHISTARMMMGIALAPQVADWVDMLMDGGEEKITVGAWHTEVMRILAERFEKWGMCVIGGKTPAKRRPDVVTEFVRNPKKQIMLLQMIAGGVGTDGLQEASCHGLLAEPDWVFANNEQFFARLDRGGQRQQVQADIFVAPNSLAERVLGNAIKKGHVVHNTLDRRPGEYLSGTERRGRVRPPHG